VQPACNSARAAAREGGTAAERRAAEGAAFKTGSTMPFRVVRAPRVNAGLSR
jgi:hypothetical protein